MESGTVIALAFASMPLMVFFIAVSMALRDIFDK